MTSPMPVVSDTSPILNLATVGQLDLLRLQFETVLVPPAVVEELKLDTDMAGTDLARSALDTGWLRMIALRDPAVSQVLRRNLDAGEAEAIALALQEQISRVLIDEHEARVAARSLGLRPIGVLGILLAAKRAGHLESIEQTVRDLKREAGFYISKDLVEILLLEAGER